MGVLLFRCIGLAAAYQGLGVTFPENASNTTCYLSEKEAVNHKCDECNDKFIFAKQGQWSNGEPTPDPKTGEVPSDSVSSAGGYYNYVTVFPSTSSYAWMNHGASYGTQTGTIAPFYPEDPHYPQTIWCVTCCTKQ